MVDDLGGPAGVEGCFVRCAAKAAQQRVLGGLSPAEYALNLLASWAMTLDQAETARTMDRP